MARGFIYVVTSVTKSYEQPAFYSVPTQCEDRLYFGPCKRPMRPRVNAGDWLFAIPSAEVSPRKILFACRVDEVLSFAQAYERFPALRGPVGPILVRPVRRDGAFPRSSYEHIPGAMHDDEWTQDLASPALDRFLVGARVDGWKNRWLGVQGPDLDEEFLAFLNSCDVFGKAGSLGAKNTGTLENPIAHGRLFTGLHLETDAPDRLISLIAARLADVALGPPPMAPRTPYASATCAPGAPITPKAPC